MSSVRIYQNQPPLKIHCWSHCLDFSKHGNNSRAVTKCDLIRALTETSILYIDGHTYGNMDGLIPVYPRKHLLCRGIIPYIWLNYLDKSVRSWANVNLRCDNSSNVLKYG